LGGKQDEEEHSLVAGEPLSCGGKLMYEFTYKIS
jgi:hypothetical protein